MVANLPVVRANLDKVFQLAEPIAKFTPFDGSSLSKARLCRKEIVIAYIKASYSAHYLKISNASLSWKGCAVTYRDLPYLKSACR